MLPVAVGILSNSKNRIWHFFVDYVVPINCQYPISQPSSKPEPNTAASRFFSAGTGLNSGTWPGKPSPGAGSNRQLQGGYSKGGLLFDRPSLVSFFAGRLLVDFRICLSLAQGCNHFFVV